MNYRRWLIVLVILLVGYYVVGTVYANQPDEVTTVITPTETSDVNTTRIPGRKTMNVSVKTPFSATMQEEDLAVLFQLKGVTANTHTQTSAGHMFAKRNGYSN